MLSQRIVAFIRGESAESFDELAQAVFRLQYEHSARLRELYNDGAVSPAGVADWRQIPAAPISALEGPGPAQRSPDPDLERTVIDHSFPAHCLRDMGRPPVLALIPAGNDAPDPALALMADHLLRTWAAPDSVAMTRRRIEVARARSFMGARQRDRRPTLVLATTESLTRLFETLDRHGLRFRLPPGSRVIETGGPVRASPSLEGSAAAGAVLEDTVLADPAVRGPGLLARLAAALAVPAEGLAREYAVHGLTSRIYAGHDPQGEPQPFQTPPWVRTRVLDPATLAEAPAGAEGVLAVLDLASLSSAAHLLTGDMAVADEAGGFRLTGAVATGTF